MTCASAASAIALQADDWLIYESSTMMVHSCSYSPGYGKESSIRTRAEYTERLNRELIERTYNGFLCEEEIIEVVEYGKDLYFFADDLSERMSLLHEHRNQCKTWQTEDPRNIENIKQRNNKAELNVS